MAVMTHATTLKLEFLIVSDFEPFNGQHGA